MPSFHHLSEAEIHSLVAYLNQLAGVPGAEKEQVAIQEPHARVGELIVKSTCHVCHDATGLNPTPVQLLDGTIPPLNALPVRVNQAQLARKVTSGAPVIMGTPSSVYRGRMPVFSYLHENEAADVYEYLTQYPSTESAIFSQTAQTTRSDATDPPTDSSEAHLGEHCANPHVTNRRCHHTRWELVRRLMAASAVRPVTFLAFYPPLLL
jgi:mono/diheme cytochrome c family protein